MCDWGEVGVCDWGVVRVCLEILAPVKLLGDSEGG